jgi:hypothetical protein
VKKGKERWEEGNTPRALRTVRGKENLPTSISISTPKGKKVYKRKDMVTGTTMPSIPSHRHTIPLTTNSPPFYTKLQEHPEERDRTR